jgi:hypothetical protein
MSRRSRKEYKDSIRLVSLSGYEIPKVEEHHKNDWVEYGEDNCYFSDLVERYLGSATNSRCINGIVDMIYGRGLNATDSETNPIQFGKMKVLLRPKEVKKIVNDIKLLGMASMQILYKNGKKEIDKVLHFPMETLRAEKAKDGKIKAYYYHPNWKEIKHNDKPKRIPSFGNGTASQLNEIYIVKPYRSGFYYYTPVDYQGCLQYCSLEEEVSNYHINNIQNGLQPSLLMNFNNGIPNEETQQIIENKVYDKFSGTSNAGKFILAFNEDSDSQSTVEPIHLPDAHAQYEFLATESREKIMIGHGVVSPILLGIKDNTGFGNNAEELRTASILMDNIVIRPFQTMLIDAFKELLSFNNIMLDLYFVTLQPIEFTELENISTKVKREEETGEKLSSDKGLINKIKGFFSSEEKNQITEDEGQDLLDQLEELGEVVSNDWELVYREDVVDGKEDFDVTKLSQPTVDDANPKKESTQDNAGYKVRYAYKEVVPSKKSRLFCQKMMELARKGIVFRLEDINMMSFRGVNKKHGHKGRNYSLFKWKGGVNCKHIFERKVYKKKVSSDSVVSESSANNEGFKSPNNPKEVGQANWNRPDKGRFTSKK